MVRHTAGFRPQTQKLEQLYERLIITNVLGAVNCWDCELSVDSKHIVTCDLQIGLPLRGQPN